jgi:hypothetical protein
VLRGPQFQRLFPDVYAPAHLKDDLILRSRAPGVLVAGRGAVAGYSAAELLGASSGPPGPAEVLLTAPRSQSYRCEGLRVHRDRIGAGEITGVGGIAVTTPERTAYDLARWAPTLTERVAAVDALAHHRGVDLADVLALRNRHLGARRGGEVAGVLRLADRRAESPMESRARVTLVDGADHRTQQRARRDLEREAALVSVGWRILRFDAYVVLFEPERILAEVRAEIAAAGRPTG